ncbi:hypothetical protein E3N88_30978 [Mikania micrantha]|uniref:Uncharacterized protein n=1 Tax=Mikania micrantha TaxID=192012 RepID=A0A5N6MR41_9ASTR|nr:hypothetical protein E3N88_30978 [Mikania micrantha]
MSANTEGQGKLKRIDPVHDDGSTGSVNRLLLILTASPLFLSHDIEDHGSDLVQWNHSGDSSGNIHPDPIVVQLNISAKLDSMEILKGEQRAADSTKEKTHGNCNYTTGRITTFPLFIRGDPRGTDVVRYARTSRYRSWI